MSVITLRTDGVTDAALKELTADGRSTSAAVREAILRAARESVETRVHMEAEAVAADPEDLAEARAVLHDMETLRAW